MSEYENLLNEYKDFWNAVRLMREDKKPHTIVLKNGEKLTGVYSNEEAPGDDDRGVGCLYIMTETIRRFLFADEFDSIDPEVVTA